MNTHAAGTYAGTGPHPVRKAEHLRVVDERRDREIEITCRYPTEAGSHKLLVWCHGLGGSRHRSVELTRLWASHGFVVIQPTFLDSIEHVARDYPDLGLKRHHIDNNEWVSVPEIFEFMIGRLLQPPWWLARVADVKAVLDQAPTLLDEVAEFAGTVDGERVGVGGHSFGAYTSQLVSGVTINLPGEGPTSLRDDRVGAVVIASGQGRNQQGLRDGSWDTMACPMLNITGSKDMGATTDDPNWKREPFLFAPPGDKYEAWMEGADHGLGGISGNISNFVENADQRRIVEQTTLAFWRAYIAGDADAMAWLNSDSPSEFGAPILSFERR
ncbi:alpha/beta hydrolase family protein [Candidatus Poriferisodalis sp.]|uniref:alpha/beta hydrolase family protein n=1 Tax=Candidatus Poriferisodalis sp. TaxID=3101277 RepID=UPI003B5199B6